MTPRRTPCISARAPASPGYGAVQATTARSPSTRSAGSTWRRRAICAAVSASSARCCRRRCSPTRRRRPASRGAMHRSPASVARYRLRSGAAISPTPVRFLRCARRTVEFALAPAPSDLCVFERGYTAPASWRGNLSYASQYKRVVYSLDGTYSLNVDQSAIVDLNTRTTPVFSTSGRGTAALRCRRRRSCRRAGLITPLQRLAAARDRFRPGVHASGRTGARVESPDHCDPLARSLLGDQLVGVGLLHPRRRPRVRENGFNGTTFRVAVHHAGGTAQGARPARRAFQLQGGYSITGFALSVFARLLVQACRSRRSSAAT